MKSKTQVQKAILAVKKQAGMTLMEIIAALAIIAAVVVGALALFNSAQSSNQAVTMLKDITAIRSAAQQLYLGQGGYGTASLLGPLDTAKKIPTDIVVVAGTPPKATTPLGGVLEVTGITNKFSIKIDQVPVDVCIQLLTNASSGWSQVVVGGHTITKFPVSLAIASDPAQGCLATNNSIVWDTVS